MSLTLPEGRQPSEAHPGPTRQIRLGPSYQTSCCSNHSAPQPHNMPALSAKQLQTRYLCASLSLSYTHTPLPVVQVRQVTLTPCCRLLELLHVNRAIAIPAYTHTHTQATEPLPSATVVRPSPFVMNRLHSNELTHQTCQTEPSPPSHHAPSDNTHTHTHRRLVRVAATPHTVAVGEGAVTRTYVPANSTLAVPILVGLRGRSLTTLLRFDFRFASICECVQCTRPRSQSAPNRHTHKQANTKPKLTLRALSRLWRISSDRRRGASSQGLSSVMARASLATACSHTHTHMYRHT